MTISGFFWFFPDRPGCWGGLPFAGMPRPCAVVAHVGFYGVPFERWDATALCRGGSRWFLRVTVRALGCHGLVPWWLTLVSTGYRSSAGMPRPCAVVAHVGFLG